MAEFALYLHIPFCQSKCAYCDFSSWAGCEGQMEEYLRALYEEIEVQGARFASGRSVSSIFFGGGTPTLLSGAQLSSLMEDLRRHFSFCEDAEITMEANPGTLSAENLALYRQAGVNRLSLGVQSFSDKLLHRVGRIHTAQQAVTAVQMAQEAGFDRINLDLMYGLPGQTEADFAASVSRAASLGVGHLSLYSLILEEGTPLEHMVRRGECSLPSEEETLSMQHEAQAYLLRKGYRRYEISNYSLPGQQCRHNLLYWQRGEYLGMGCAAHSLMEETRFANPSSLNEYLSGKRAESVEKLTLADVYEETVMLGLRTSDGISLDLLREREEVVKRLLSGGLLQMQGKDRVCVTQRGADLLNSVILELI